MENKRARKIVIILCIILVFGIIAYITYNTVLNRQLYVYIEPAPVAIDLNKPVIDQYEKQMDKVNIYGVKCDVKIPGINATVKGAKELNNKIAKDYIDVINESKRENASTPYEVSYIYTYEPILRYVYINITTKIMGNEKVKTYIYDVKQDKEILIEDLFLNYGITIPKIKNRIKMLTKINIDIMTLSEDIVRNNLSIKYIDSNKITLEFVYQTERAEVTYSINEKATNSMAMDAVNEKKEMGTSTTGDYKLYLNIKLPKIKIDTVNANIFNEKIKKQYDDILEYYKVEEIEPATGDVQTEEKKPTKAIINSYDVSYKYSYIEGIGAIYLTVTTKEMSGKETETEHVKTIITYKTYLYNVSEDKEMYIDELFAIYNTTESKLITDILNKNNIKDDSTEAKNIKTAMMDKSNIYIIASSENKLELILKAYTKEYYILFEK